VDPCIICPNCSIEQIAIGLSAWIAGRPEPQFDLVAHSTGGLVARAYLAGLQPDLTFAPPSNPRVRKFIEIATPNFGAFQALGPQSTEITLGSAFLWNLATWNQGNDDLRGVDSLAIVGNAGFSTMDDGVVSLTSASLGFARDASRTRVLPYCHTSGLAGCSVSGGIANVDEAPETGQIVRSFLADTAVWTTTGKAVSDDPWLSQFGGVYFAYQDANAVWLSDLSGVSFGGTVLQQGAAAFYTEFVSGTGSFQATSASIGAITCGPVTQPSGSYGAWRCKNQPAIMSVTPLVAGAAKVVASGATITIQGAGFGQLCSNCQVLAYGNSPLQLSSWTDSAITASLPATYSGLVSLLVQTATGRDWINIMVVTGSPSNTPAISSVVNGASFQPGISAGAWVSIFGTNLASTTRSWRSDEIVNGKLPTQLDGVSVTIDGKPAAVSYISPTQLNVQVPDVSGAAGTVDVVVTNSMGTSKGSAAMRNFAPGFFMYDPSNRKYIAAQHADYSIVGPPGLFSSTNSTPAKPGEVVILYSTGLGPTTPPTPSGQVVSKAAQIQDLSALAITVGGQTAHIEYAGITMAGVWQINVQIPDNLPDGDAVVKAQIGGQSTQSNAFITVRR
jgi:uncharacterized protein (TIGR03437 family)